MQGMQTRRDKLYQHHLDQISRSFSFCIAELESPARQWIGLSYILCRIADSIEDVQWPFVADQLKTYDGFMSFLLRRPSIQAVNEWSAKFPTTLIPVERDLINDAPIFLDDFFSLDLPVQSAMRRTLLNMLRGMKNFSIRSAAQGKSSVVKDPVEVDQYCFFVAGVVGELLTELMAIASPEFRADTHTLRQAVHFGLFLQKINILKDQQTDEAEGRFFLPSRRAVEMSLPQHAVEAFEYIKAIPLCCRGYRVFCAWSFFLGLLSLPWIARAHREQRAIKISRAETFAKLAQIKFLIDDNAALAKVFESLRAKAFDGDSRPGGSTFRRCPGGTTSGLEALYQGSLEKSDLAQFGFLR